MNEESEHTHRLRSAAIQLVIASFVVLFQEMALIRWLPSQVRVLGYFPNVVLISAFLGLGLGCLRARRASLLWLWPVSLVVLIATAIGLSRIAFTQESVSEHLWLLYHDIPNAPVVRNVRLPIILLFILTGVTFIPLGQLVAQRLRDFRDGGASLWGYSFDLLGSLLGVIGFALASFARSFPVAWFAVVGVAGLWLTWRSPRLRVGYAACMVLMMVMIAGAEKAERYSPYYALRRDVATGRAGVQILANGSFHQYPTVVSGDAPLPHPQDELVRSGYHVPYRALGRTPRKVLVLGAGTGNDVAVALDEGAGRVDAVEIDPVILDLGRTEHPDNPYASPRVRLINADARDYLNRTGETYDLIVFGTLDSMTRLSALSGVRLDNFVYTTDCVRAARRLLTDDGGIIMYFAVGSQYIHDRLMKMLAETFGEVPRNYAQGHWMFNHVFMAGPAFPPETRSPDETARIAGALALVEAPSDDWPFLYLRGRGISPFYLSLIAAFAALALLGLFITAPDMLRGWTAGAGLSPGRTAGGRFDAEMFLFGAAFLLLETKSVTEMNLVWGVTWLTSAVVIGTVLATLLASTILMQLRPLPWRISVTGLVVSLLVSYATPTHVLLGHPAWLTLVLSAVFVGLPIFFASTCFALRFRERTAPDVAFGWNLLGTVAGGSLEFLSMAIGFRALSLVALAAYLLAFALGARFARLNEPIAATVEPEAAPTVVGS